MTDILLLEEICKIIFSILNDDPTYSFLPIVCKEWMKICLTLEDKPWIIEKDQLLKIPKRYRTTELTISSNNINLLEFYVAYYAKLYLRSIVSMKDISSDTIDTLIGRFGMKLKTKHTSQGLTIDYNWYYDNRLGQIKSEMIDNLETLNYHISIGNDVHLRTLTSTSIDIIKWRVIKGYSIYSICTDSVEGLIYSLAHFYNQNHIQPWFILEAVVKCQFEVVKEAYNFFKFKDKNFIISDTLTIPGESDINEYIKVLNNSK